MRTRNLPFVAAVLGAALLSACSSTPSVSSTSGTVDSPSSAIGVAAQQTTDDLTPLLATALNQPVPVEGTDDRFHVAYELQVVNASTRPAHLTQVRSVAPDGRTLASVQGEDLVSRTQLVGDMSDPPVPATELPVGRVAILMLDDVYATKAEIPATFDHVLVADFGAVPAGSHPFATQYPDHVEERTGAVTIGAGAPLVIGAPLRGTNWLAGNACCEVTAHRGTMLPLDGRLNAAERYAIDFLRVDPAPLDDPSKNTSGGIPSVPAGADPTKQESYLAYGADLLAVADATVADVVDGRDDAVPATLTPGLTIDELGGNYVLLDLGGGFYAFYGHVRKGSFTVTKGQHVRKGEVIAKLGNSGNSSEAHLHFHLSRGPTPLAADQWPFVFDHLALQGTLVGIDKPIDRTGAGPRTDEYPLTWTVVDFP